MAQLSLSVPFIDQMRWSIQLFFLFKKKAFTFTTFILFIYALRFSHFCFLSVLILLLLLFFFLAFFSYFMKPVFDLYHHFFVLKTTHTYKFSFHINGDSEIYTSRRNILLCSCCDFMYRIRDAVWSMRMFAYLR